jgi:short-subunit dehydrogenase
MAIYSGKTVLITGASSGIGEALARAFSSQGANLVLLARRIDRLTVLANELSQRQQKAIAIQADVSLDGEVERAVEKAIAEFGQLDVVVPNAGFSVGGRLDQLKLEDYRRQFEVNVFGVLRTVQASIPALKKTQGRIVLIGSVLGLISAPETTAYAMTKFAMCGLADGLHAELAKSGVSVTLILPGFIETEIFNVSNKNEPIKFQGKDRPPSWLMMPASKAAAQIVRATTRRRRRKILTAHGKAGAFFERFFPGLVAWSLKRFA